MDNFISDYITSKLGGYSNPIVTKTGNKYTCRYQTSNKRFNEREYRSFKADSGENITFIIMIGGFVAALTGLLCMIPHVLGAISFTLVNLLIMYLLMRDNRYDAIVYGSIWFCLFLIALFCIHFILTSDAMHSPAYKAFHTIYPEYLFKFKFK